MSGKMDRKEGGRIKEGERMDGWMDGFWCTV